MTRTNIINAILNIVEHDDFSLSNVRNTRNRAQAMGEAFEEYVKDIFAGTLNANKSDKLKLYKEYFSYGGGVNNPPDVMIRGGAAIEIKKVQSIGSIPLNSSYPKSKLHSDDPRIASDCKNAEHGEWTEKDMIYAIGQVKDNVLRSIALVYGDVYCAKREYYENIFTNIKDSLQSSHLQLENSNELAHINAVDPLGITYFRARAMWGIEHPFRVFDYVYEKGVNHSFDLMAIIPTEIYDSFYNKELLDKLALTNKNFSIASVQVKNPNNIVETIDVKLVTYYKE